MRQRRSEQVYFYVDLIHLVSSSRRCGVKFYSDITEETHEHLNKSLLIGNLLWHNISFPQGAERKDRPAWGHIVPELLEKH